MLQRKLQSHRGFTLSNQPKEVLLEDGMGLKSEVGEWLGERTSHLPKQNKVGRNEKCSYQMEEDAVNPSTWEAEQRAG